MSTTAHLDGVPLLLDVPARWSMTTGTTPFVGSFDVTRKDADRLLAGAGVRTSVLELHGFRWEALSILYLIPGRRRRRTRIVVADRRFWWSWQWIQMFFNISRRRGTVRRQAWSKDTPLLVDPVPLLDFAAFSVNPDGSRVAPVEAFRRALGRVDPTATLVVQDENLLRVVPLQDVPIDADGGVGLDQVLRYLPAGAVTVDPRGRVRLFSWNSRVETSILGDGELQIFGSVGVGVWDQGIPEYVDMSLVQPREYEVLFTPETELRFDFVGDDPPPGETTVSATEVGRVPRHVENVAPLPDHTNTLATGEVVATGTYLTIKQLIQMWIVGRGLLREGLSFALLNRAMCPWNNRLWASLDLLERRNAGGGPNSVQAWAARVAVLQDWYRQGFRLPRQWTDNALALRPYLVATLDRVSGQRAPAVVYGDHCLLPGSLARWSSGRSSESMPTFINVSGYPGQDVEITDEHHPSPCTVSIPDEDQGIVRLNYHADPFGQNRRALPSRLDGLAGLDRVSSNNRESIYLNARSSKQTASDLVRLADEQRLAILLTGVPANVLFRVIVPASKVGFPGARGPRRQVRVRAETETARIAWRQAQAEVVARAWGLAGATTPADRQAAMDELAKNCVNLGGVASGAASLTAIAEALARSHLAEVASRTMGGGTFGMRGNAAALAPAGAIDGVTHVVGADGSALTTVTTRGMLPHVDLVAYLGGDMQKIVLRQVK